LSKIIAMDWSWFSIVKYKWLVYGSDKSAELLEEEKGIHKPEAEEPPMNSESLPES
jgi:hypothetical protein